MFLSNSALAWFCNRYTWASLRTVRMLTCTAVKRMPLPRYWQIGIPQVRCIRCVGSFNRWNPVSLTLIKSTFNVSLGIAEFQIRDRRLVSVNNRQNSKSMEWCSFFFSCPVTADPHFPWNVPCESATLEARLSLFSQWRGTRSNDNLGLWHLMSGCPTGAVIGIAWLGTL